MSAGTSKETVVIRAATIRDRGAIHDVHMSAFPDDERAPVAKLATDLLATASSPETVSLVAEVDGRIAGHVAFSPVRAEGNENWLGYILAPLGVRPEHHKRGIGSQLVRRGLERLSDAGVDAVFVYGDPAYYGRFGFHSEAAERFKPPYPLQYPFGWQAILGGDAGGNPGSLSFVAALDDPGLW
jgi:putative acetyltransferase